PEPNWPFSLATSADSHATGTGPTGFAGAGGFGAAAAASFSAAATGGVAGGAGEGLLAVAPEGTGVSAADLGPPSGGGAGDLVSSGIAKKNEDSLRRGTSKEA